MPVAEYCRTEIATATPNESVRDAAVRMGSLGVGCLVVVDDAHRPVGMVTDRDLALGAIRRRIDADATPLSAVMHVPVITVTSGAPIWIAIRFMRKNALRRIPVVDEETGKLAGLVTCDDMLQLISSELSAVATVVRHQFPADLRGDHALAPGAIGE